MFKDWLERCRYPSTLSKHPHELLFNCRYIYIKRPRLPRSSYIFFIHVMGSSRFEGCATLPPALRNRSPLTVANCKVHGECTRTLNFFSPLSCLLACWGCGGLKDPWPEGLPHTTVRVCKFCEALPGSLSSSGHRGRVLLATRPPHCYGALKGS